jgi:hypothetical protein
MPPKNVVGGGIADAREDLDGLAQALEVQPDPSGQPFRPSLKRVKFRVRTSIIHASSGRGRPAETAREPRRPTPDEDRDSAPRRPHRGTHSTRNGVCSRGTRQGGR